MVFELCRVTNIIFGGIFKNSCISLTRFGGNKYLTALKHPNIVLKIADYFFLHCSPSLSNQPQDAFQHYHIAVLNTVIAQL